MTEGQQKQQVDHDIQIYAAFFQWPFSESSACLPYAYNILSWLFLTTRIALSQPRPDLELHDQNVLQRLQSEH